MKSHLILILLLGSAALDLAARTQQAVPLPSWQESQSKDPVDEPRRQFSLTGKFLAPLQGKPANPPTLLLKCAPDERSDGKGKFRVGIVVVGLPLKIHFVEIEERKTGISYYPEVSVSYRLDGGKELKDDWPPRFDKSSVEFEKSDFKKMLRAHTILITMAGKDGRQVLLQFDMPDSTAAPLTSAQVAEACGVNDLQK
jgi:hypothetical protein